jgi:hypothetical protein
VQVAAGEPESTIVAEAPEATAFSVPPPVATLEHLVLMYLYSNPPRHLGDLARIVTKTQVDLGAVERYLADVHPEMLPVLKERVLAAWQPCHPCPAPSAVRARPRGVLEPSDGPGRINHSEGQAASRLIRANLPVFKDFPAAPR